MYQIIKRALDVIIAVICLLFFAPIMIVVTIAIKLDSPEGPVFADTPKRLGKDRKPFFMYKFRSMIPNAHKILYTDPKYKKFAEKHKKSQGKLRVDEDPRITNVGRFIRKTDIDEMPQFFNVLLGNMSIVGPRAYYEDELNRYLDEFPEINAQVEAVLSVKPGITGPWQVSGRNSLTVPDRFKIDSDYAKKKSLMYDFYIMLQTPIAVFTRKGAYE